jgi:predicted lipoprotein with Yx(FWY)xxD motif
VNRTLPAIAVLAVGALLAVAGCGSSGSSSSGGGAYGGGEETASTKAASSNAEPSAVVAAVAVGNSPGLGKIVVDSEGFTLYDFHKDKGTASSCYGPCAKAWPPLTTSGAPQATKGAEASKLGTTKRSDGTMQVTYAGHPLYTFVEDSKPGDAKGNDTSAFGAQWYALSPSGEEAGG